MMPPIPAQVPHLVPHAQLSHAAECGAGFVVWHVSQHRQHGRSYGDRNETRTRANHIMGEKSTLTEFLHNQPPSIDSASLASLVTFRHNRPPIDSPILRLTIRDLARDAKQRETLQI